MLKKEEREWIYGHAYLPEHVPDYVKAISGAEPHLHEGHLCFLRQDHLTFIGYPLEPDMGTQRAYETACERFRPATVAIIAPAIWLPSESYETQPGDTYYRLQLPMDPLDLDVAYMVRRGRRELKAGIGDFGREHQKIIKEFLSGHDLGPEQRKIYRRIPRYMSHSRTARILDARKGKTLTAFTIVDLGSADYAFYQFSFRSARDKIPGASDVLFYEMVKLAESEGKKAINLGLGIHPGIRRFKEKWGGMCFLAHESAFVHRKPVKTGGLFKKL